MHSMSGMHRCALWLASFCLVVAVNSASPGTRLAEADLLNSNADITTLGIALGLDASFAASMRDMVVDGAFKAPMSSDRGVPDGVVCQESDW